MWNLNKIEKRTDRKKKDIIESGTDFEKRKNLGASKNKVIKHIQDIAFRHGGVVVPLNDDYKKMKNEIKIFELKKVRSHWDEKTEQWFFSVIDVVEILTGSSVPKRYWSDLKKKLVKEGNEVYEKIVRLKMQAEDGKMRETDVANTQIIFRIIQSIPSPKAEPFKLWLAKVGYERIQEISDPAQSLDRARENWQNLGRSEKWIQQRMTGQETRNKLTDYWKESGVEKSDEFAYLTNIIHKEWTGVNVKQHKNIKGLKQQNLRDHMSEAELIFTSLAELSTRQIAESETAKGVQQNAIAGKKGGKIAKDARLALEQKTGKSVITSDNFLPPSKIKNAQIGKKN